MTDVLKQHTNYQSLIDVYLGQQLQNNVLTAIHSHAIHKNFLWNGHQSSHIFLSVQSLRNTVLTADIITRQDMAELISQISHKFPHDKFLKCLNWIKCTHFYEKNKVIHTIPIFSLIILFACSIWSGDPRITNTFSAGFGGGLRSNSQCAPVCWLICLIVSPPADSAKKKKPHLTLLSIKHIKSNIHQITQLHNK